MRLVNKKTRELVGFGEQVPNPYGEGTLTISQIVTEKREVKYKRYQLVHYVEAFRTVINGQATDYDHYEPWRLGLEIEHGDISQTQRPKG